MQPKAERGSGEESRGKLKCRLHNFHTKSRDYFLLLIIFHFKAGILLKETSVREKIEKFSFAFTPFARLNMGNSARGGILGWWESFPLQVFINCQK